MRPLHATITIATAFTLLLAGFSLLPDPAQAQGNRRLVLEISDATANPTQSFEAFDTVQFTVFDFDGDGDQEILAKNDNNWVYVLDSRTGRVLAEMKDGVYDGWKFRELSGAAVGDVNGNGRWDIVSPSSAGIVTVWELDPAKSTGEKFHFDKLWSKRIDPSMADPQFREKNPWAANESTGFDGAPYLADVDGDGADEIFLQSDNVAGQWAFKGDGTMLWGKVFDDGNANPWVADLDRDGKLEVVFATDGGRVWVYDAKTGGYKWKFDVRDHGVSPGSISLAPGLIDLTGDGRLEVVFGARQAVENKSDPDWISKQHTQIFALTSKGEVLWQKSYDWGEPHVYMWPAAYDVDGDGIDDAVMMDWNTIGHKPGNWESTGPPNLFAINGKGELLFTTKVSTYWSNKNVIIADVDGDGKQNIVVNKGGVEDGIAYFDMSGKQVGGFTLPMSASRAPLVADLYGDGRMHMVVPVATARSEPNYRNLDVGYRAGKLLVYDMGVQHNAAWDNVVRFNLKFDHLYGGKASGDAKPVVHADIKLVNADPFTVRVTSDKPVERVTARGDGAADAVELTRSGDEWSGAVTGTSIQVTAMMEGGGFVTKTVQRPATEPTPVTPTTPTAPTDATPTTPTAPTASPTDDGNGTPPATATPDESTDPTPDTSTQGQDIPLPGAALLAAALAAAALVICPPGRRRR